MYVVDVIKGRWVEAEPVIAKYAYHSYKYAFAIRQPFPEGEEVISKDSACSYQYACFVIKKRFIMGEPAILHSAYAKYYRDFFNKLNLL